MRAVASLLCLALCGAVSLSVTGCSLSSTAPPTADAGLAIRGTVHGGNQPITGAHVYLLAANITGNAGPGIAAASINKSNSLLTTGSSDSVGTYVTTDPSGNFTISSNYSCTPNTQVYLYALGGNPGLTAGTNNTASGLLAVLGNCPSAGNFLSTTPFIDVNEVSTIAAAYAFAGYATDADHVSSSGTPLAKIGIANAFANAANLETLSTGVAQSQVSYLNGTVTVPTGIINTLADILAACVNTTGLTSTCSTLFADALSGGTTGTQPTDTATAAINIAHNPGANVAALYGLAATSPPFVGLSTQPNDLTIVLTISASPGVAIIGAEGIAIDGSGNVWVAGNANNDVGELSSLGAPLSGFSGYTGGGLNSPWGIAVDNNTPPNIWVTNNGGNSVTELNSSGTAVTGSPHTVGGLNGPFGIAIDGTGNLWIANNGNSTVTQLTSSGAAENGTPFNVGGLSGSVSIAIDTSENAWITNSTGTSVTELTSTGTVHAGAPYSVGGVHDSVGVAIDGSNNAWISNKGTTSNTVTKLSNSGAAASGSPYTGGGLAAGDFGFVAIDGAGNAWITNSGSGTVTELSSSGAAISGTGGYASGFNTGPNIYGLSGQNPFDLAIDGSGNVWVTCIGTVEEIVGAATPVVTPLSTAVANSKLGTRP